MLRESLIVPGANGDLKLMHILHWDLGGDVEILVMDLNVQGSNGIKECAAMRVGSQIGIVAK